MTIQIVVSSLSSRRTCEGSIRFARRHSGSRKEGQASRRQASELKPRDATSDVKDSEQACRGRGRVAGKMTIYIAGSAGVRDL